MVNVRTMARALTLVAAAAVLFASCAVTDAVDISLCKAEECTREQWLDIFEQAVTELDGEGVVIDHETLAGDPEVYAAVFRRMLQLADADDSDLEAVNRRSQSSRSPTTAHWSTT